jgi:monoamine oxidase
MEYHDLNFQEILSKLADGSEKNSCERVLHQYLDQSNISVEDLQVLNEQRESMEVLKGRPWSDVGCAQAKNPFEGNDFIFQQGHDTLLPYLAEGLVIHRNTVVKKIIQKPNELSILTTNGDYSCEHCILTVPVGVLRAQKIQFEPELPALKWEAINRVSDWPITKVALQFESGTWNNDFQFLSRQGEHPLVMNWSRFSGAPILIAHLTGNKAKEAEEMSKNELLGYLEPVVGRIARMENIQGLVTSKWSSSPYSLGGFCYQSMQAYGNEADVISKPFGELYFGGEAASQAHTGTVHGAYFSGQVAASHILKKISKKGGTTYNSI